MKYLRNIIFVLLIALTACGLPSSSPATPLAPNSTATPQQAEPTETAAPAGMADIIFMNGDILTMDPANPNAQAIAMAGNKILALGSNEDIMAYRDEATVLTDLAGRTMMPGFVDAHSHIIGEHLIYDRDPLPDQQLAIEYGMTTTAEFYVDQSILDKLKALADAGKLRLRVNAYLLHSNNCGDILGDWWKNYQPNQQIAPNLYVRGIKIFTDGGSCQVPAISVDYEGGGKGDLYFTQEQLNQIVADVQVSGFQAVLHALGDRAVEQSQNAIASALAGQPNTPRHRIDHNAVIRPELLNRYSEIGIVPVIFGAYPTCMRTTGEGRYPNILPEDYGEWEWPWRALVDANPGFLISWQADYPSRNLSPIYNMWATVTRKAVAADGSICNPPDWLKAGALHIDEFLPMMTRNSAYALFFENEVGSLEAGKLADLVILSDNPLQVESDKLNDISVLMTMIDGKTEYCAVGFDSFCPSASSSDLEPASVTASASLPNSPPSNAMDGNTETAWNSGAGAEQWIQIDLENPTTVSAIRLFVAQFPEGETVHQIWVGVDPNSLTLVHEFKGATNDSSILEFIPPAPLPNIQFVKVVTTQSPSWVAWREIEIR